MQVSTKHYKLKSKFRFTVFVAFMLILMTFTTNTILGNNFTNGLTKETFTQVIVESGDSLWNIASKFGPQNQDPRKMVDKIRQANGISDNQSIQPGQILLVPVYIEAS